MALNNSHGGEYTQTENGSILQRLSTLSGTVCDRLRSIKALPDSKTALSTRRSRWRRSLSSASVNSGTSKAVTMIVQYGSVKAESVIDDVEIGSLNSLSSTSVL